MTHFAVFCPPYYGHIRVQEALAAVLARRGHRVTFVLNKGGSAFVSTRDAAVEEVPSADSARAELEAVVQHATRPSGIVGILRVVSDAATLTDALCAGAPDILRRIGAEAVIGDQMEPAAGLVAGSLNLPFASVAAALPINSGAGIPPLYLGWPYDPSPYGLKRNAGAEWVTDMLLFHQRRVIRKWASRFGIGPRFKQEDCLSERLQIVQTVPGFDYPRVPDSTYVHVGPIRSAGASLKPLPFTRDPSKPLIFASLGTLQGHRIGIFKAIAEACRDLDVELLIAHGGRLSETQARSLDATFVADFVPQTAVLAVASAVVTNGGMNTVMDAMLAGVPALVIPIGFDQKGVAARVVYRGVGRRLSHRFLDARAVRSALKQLLVDPSFRERAAAISREIAASGGVETAADLIEKLVATPEKAPARMP